MKLAFRIFHYVQNIYSISIDNVSICYGKIQILLKPRIS